MGESIEIKKNKIKWTPEKKEEIDQLIEFGLYNSTFAENHLSLTGQIINTLGKVKLDILKKEIAGAELSDEDRKTSEIIHPIDYANFDLCNYQIEFIKTLQPLEKMIYANTDPVKAYGDIQAAIQASLKEIDSLKEKLTNPRYSFLKDSIPDYENYTQKIIDELKNKIESYQAEINKIDQKESMDFSFQFELQETIRNALDTLNSQCSANSEYLEDIKSGNLFSANQDINKLIDDYQYCQSEKITGLHQGKLSETDSYLGKSITFTSTRFDVDPYDLAKVITYIDKEKDYLATLEKKPEIKLKAELKQEYQQQFRLTYLDKSQRHDFIDRLDEQNDLINEKPYLERDWGERTSLIDKLFEPSLEDKIKNLETKLKSITSELSETEKEKAPFTHGQLLREQSRQKKTLNTLENELAESNKPFLEKAGNIFSKIGDGIKAGASAVGSFFNYLGVGIKNTVKYAAQEGYEFTHNLRGSTDDSKSIINSLSTSLKDLKNDSLNNIADTLSAGNLIAPEQILNLDNFISAEQEQTKIPILTEEEKKEAEEAIDAIDALIEEFQKPQKEKGIEAAPGASLELYNEHDILTGGVSFIKHFVGFFTHELYEKRPAAAAAFTALYALTGGAILAPHLIGSVLAHLGFSQNAIHGLTALSQQTAHAVTGEGQLNATIGAGFSWGEIGANAVDVIKDPTHSMILKPFVDKFHMAQQTGAFDTTSGAAASITGSALQMAVIIGAILGAGHFALKLPGLNDMKGSVEAFGSSLVVGKLAGLTYDTATGRSSEGNLDVQVQNKEHAQLIQLAMILQNNPALMDKLYKDKPDEKNKFCDQIYHLSTRYKIPGLNKKFFNITERPLAVTFFKRLLAPAALVLGAIFSPITGIFSKDYKKHVSDAFKRLGGWLFEIGKTAVSAISTFGKTIVKYASKAVTAAVTTIANAWDWLKNNVSKLGDALVSAFTQTPTVQDNIRQSFSNAPKIPPGGTITKEIINTKHALYRSIDNLAENATVQGRKVSAYYQYGMTNAGTLEATSDASTNEKIHLIENIQKEIKETRSKQPERDSVIPEEETKKTKKIKIDPTSPIELTELNNKNNKKESSDGNHTEGMHT